MTGILWAVLITPPPVQPLFAEGTPHHITLQYGVERRDWEHLISLPMTAAAIAHCHSDRIQAIEVILPPWVRCQNPHPHVTVSWQQGTQPVESNAMLAAPHHREEVSYPIHTMIEWQEWGDPPVPVCKVCGQNKLGAANKTGICSRCQQNKRQPRKQL